MTAKKALQLVSSMSVLKFFPSEPGARAMIAQMLIRICGTEERAEWLVNRVLVLYDEWPGPMELRAVLCSKFQPADGIEADSTDKRYLDTGVPSEHPEEPEPKQLESRDPECRALVTTLADRKRLM